MILTSWGYTDQLPVDNNEQLRIANKAAEAIEKVNGRKYDKIGPANTVIYPAGETIRVRFGNWLSRLSD
jgi:hypothetical protein